MEEEVEQLDEEEGVKEEGCAGNPFALFALDVSKRRRGV